MNILISAGGTRERIDSVRSITNTATGRLGSL
ncbi:MAG: phosphopantothenoylcysteine synthase, partial [Treponema sp.]|nr:phosphopantothenoylcysteine synthase [Treponema sp.]